MKSRDSNFYKNKIITIPNILSTVRLLMIPFMLWAYCALESPEITAILVVLSGITDVLDGYIARKYKMTSELGKVLDPFADKMTQIAILAALSYGKLIPMDMLKAKGITEVSLTDIEVAESFGCSVKLIGRAGKLDDGRIYATVSPEFVEESCPMAHVNDVFNSILVRGNMLGDAMFYGAGAGKLPTADGLSECGIL